MKEKENSGGCLGFMEKEFDKIIIGAGLYGMYAALYCAEKGEKVLVLEYDEAPFQRATYINQARVHMGYHYPRSLSTAVKSAGYFKRFVDEFGFCIHSSFEGHLGSFQLLAITNKVSINIVERSIIGYIPSSGIAGSSAIPLIF